jgi:hypothetical protein
MGGGVGSMLEWVGIQENIGGRAELLFDCIFAVQKAQGGMGNTGVEVSIRWGLLAQMKAMSQFLLGLSQLCFNCLIGI